MEGDAAGLRRQVQAQLAGEDQQSAGRSVGGGEGAAGDGAGGAAEKIRQHRNAGAQLAAYLPVAEHAEGRLPYRQAQKRRQQQAAAQHDAPQRRGVQPCGRQHFQLLQHGGHHQKKYGQRGEHQTAAQPVAAALFLPQGVVHAGLRLLRFLRLRLVLGVVEQLLRFLRKAVGPGAAAVREAVQQAGEPLAQGHGSVNDAVLLVLQHGIHRLAHDILQTDTVRCVGQRCRHGIGRGNGLRLGNGSGVRHGDGFGFGRGRRCRGSLRCRGRLTPTPAVFGKDGVQRELVPGDGRIQLWVVTPVHSTMQRRQLRWRTASYSRMAAAAEAFREEMRPFMGMLTRKSQFSETRRVMPLPSEPMTMAAGPFRSAE